MLAFSVFSKALFSHAHRFPSNCVLPFVSPCRFTRSYPKWVSRHRERRWCWAMHTVIVWTAAPKCPWGGLSSFSQQCRAANTLFRVYLVFVSIWLIICVMFVWFSVPAGIKQPAVIEFQAPKCAVLESDKLVKIGVVRSGNLTTTATVRFVALQHPRQL